MATPKKSKKAAKPKVVNSELAEALKTIEQLRQMVESQTSAAATHHARLATAVPNHRSLGGELLVGIRNVSDQTIGIPPMFKGDPSVHLHADFGDNDPNCVSIISYAWWRELRRGPYVDRGLIIRDDSVLGSGYQAAPEDRDSEMAPGFFTNVVRDPREWIDSRTAEQITEDLPKISSEDTLMRIRRVVDQELRSIENRYPRETIPQQVAAAKKALNQLPSKYRHVDELITMRLERVDDEADPIRSVI